MLNLLVAVNHGSELLHRLSKLVRHEWSRRHCEATLLFGLLLVVIIEVLLEVYDYQGYVVFALVICAALVRHTFRDLL